METPPKDAAPVSGTAYIWSVSDRSLAIHLELDVIDRMLPEIMRGFGAVPRRGAEVGGILLGYFEKGESLSVHVTDFVGVRCEHERGPSYILSDRDRQAWLDVFARHRFTGESSVFAVGYFRSHTRDGLFLAPEDLSMMAEFFPAPHEIALLVKPFASRTSQAGFFFYEDGCIRAEAPHLEFPFRPRNPAARAELAQELAPQRRERTIFSESQPETPDPDKGSLLAPGRAAAPTESRVALPPFLTEQPARKRRAARGLWLLPFGLVALAVGVFVGLQYAPSNQGRSAWFRTPDPYSLGLSFTTSGDNLHLSWDRQAPAIVSASHGILTITDGETARKVDLGRGQLQHGSVVYRHIYEDVSFRLEVFSGGQNSVSEILELHFKPAEPEPQEVPRLQPVPPPSQPKKASRSRRR